MRECPSGNACIPWVKTESNDTNPAVHYKVGTLFNFLKVRMWKWTFLLRSCLVDFTSVSQIPHNGMLRIVQEYATTGCVDSKVMINLMSWCWSFRRYLLLMLSSTYKVSTSQQITRLSSPNVEALAGKKAGRHLSLQKSSMWTALFWDKHRCRCKFQWQ